MDIMCKFFATLAIWILQACLLKNSSSSTTSYAEGIFSVGQIHKVLQEYIADNRFKPLPASHIELLEGNYPFPPRSFRGSFHLVCTDFLKSFLTRLPVCATDTQISL